MTDEAFSEIVDVTDRSLERSMLAQRFPTPWRVEAHSESFVIRDAASKPLGYVYFAESRHQPGRNLLTRDEAWSMATNIATLQNLTKESLAEPPPTTARSTTGGCLSGSKPSPYCAG